MIRIPRTPQFRSKLILIILQIALLASSPTPDLLKNNEISLLLSTYWIACIALILCTVFWESYYNIIWFTVFVFSFILGIMGNYWQLPITWSLIQLWRSKRWSRFNVIVLFLLSSSYSNTAGVFPTIPTKDKANSVKDKEKIPEFLRGYKLNNITSCNSIDRVPWKLKTDGRKTRLLIKDQLIYANEKKPSLWELHQVINPKGFVTYIFKRDRLENGIVAGDEFLAVRGSKLERIIQVDQKKKKSLRTIESHNLKTLINRNAFTFYHQNGSTLSYRPGATDRSTLIIKTVAKEGYPLSPVYLSGLGCDRPESLELDDVKGDPLGTKSQSNPSKAKK